MNYTIVYRCTCGKIYNKSACDLPTCCKKCGNEFYKYYKFKNPNIFGGFNSIDFELSNNIEKVVAKRKMLKWIVKEKECEIIDSSKTNDKQIDVQDVKSTARMMANELKWYAESDAEFIEND